MFPCIGCAHTSALYPILKKQLLWSSTITESAGSTCISMALTYIVICDLVCRAGIIIQSPLPRVINELAHKKRCLLSMAKL